MESSCELEELRDGSVVMFRPPRPTDADSLLTLLRSLSSDARRLRFFSSAARDLEAVASAGANADGIDQIGLIALDRQARIVGHAACVRVYGLRGEVAVEVDENHRHLGLASLLLRRLARNAERAGVRTLIARVLPENAAMLAVFHGEFHAEGHPFDREIDVEFPTAVWQSIPAAL